MDKKLSNRASGFIPNSGFGAEGARREMLRAQSLGLVKFSGGGNSFADEKLTQSVFKITLNNSGLADKTIALHPGLLTLAEIATIVGISVDAIAKDGVIIADAVSGSSKAGTTIEFFQKWLNNNPSRAIRMQISASDEDQLDESIVLAKVHPTTKLGQFELTPSNSKKPTDTNAKLVVVDLPNFQLDDQSVLYTTVLAGRTLTINFYLGGSINHASNLEQMAAASVK